MLAMSDTFDRYSYCSECGHVFRRCVPEARDVASLNDIRRDVLQGVETLSPRRVVWPDKSTKAGRSLDSVECCRRVLPKPVSRSRFDWDSGRCPSERPWTRRQAQSD